MFETVSGTQKILILLMFWVSVFSQKAFAQCDANFSYQIDSTRGSVEFTNLSVKANPDSVLYSSWLDTSGNVLSNSTHPILTLGPGSFDICLQINNAGCSDSVCQNITIPPIYCLADYTYTVDANRHAQFNNTSEGLNPSYFWSFGDGQYSTDSSASHTYSTNGWYYVCLNIQNSDSTCEDVKCEFVRVNKPSPEPCQANFDYSYDTTNNKHVLFQNLSTGDTSITYVWLFGDDVTSTEEHPTYEFSTYGDHAVCLLVSGPDCADSICKVVEVLLILPFCEARFSSSLFADSSQGTNRIAVFTNQSEGDNISYHWDFGDDSSSNEIAPIHYYPTNGTYTVCLTVTNGALCSDSFCEEIIIQPLSGLETLSFANDLRVYPIPVQQQLTLEWTGLDHTSIEMTLTDMLGRVVYRQQIENTDGANHYLIPFDTLNKGLYVLSLQSATGRRTVKVIK